MTELIKDIELTLPKINECIFCKGKARIHKIYTLDGFKSRLICTKCGACTAFYLTKDTNELAILAWNEGNVKRGKIKCKK